MTLAVEADDLHSYARLVRRAGEDCGNGLTYLDKSTSIGFSVSGEAWNLVIGDHAEKVRQATDVLSRFGVILRGSEKELRKSASWYRTVDLGRARALDATYPGAGATRPVVRPRPHGGADFGDVRDASGRLVSGGGGDSWVSGHARELAFAPVNKGVGSLLDLGSISALANEGLKYAFDFDVLGTVANWLVGDWQEYSDCADAWNCLGNMCADAAENLRHGNEVLGLSWRGNAADAAWMYFDRTAAKFDTARDAFHSLRDDYVGVAEIVFSFADFVKGAVARLCDEAVEAAIAAAASAAVAVSGVGILGSFVGAAIAAERVAAMVKTYGELVDRYESLLLALTAALGVAGIATVTLCNELKRFPVIGGSYDNKLV
ncbi:hypothetical protein [Streptomyces xanthii]|uniref:Uncharacterized protein n=1 Tax=Streptomyces xanthii TaxID=2768069 RepID=A0A7H1B5I5_9ACTN|nr:hypothetical protein [Streptomyces xanthii]QNS03990.1 hypothetical protein IAG42_10385 [Streptomyces xanthii]